VHLCGSVIIIGGGGCKRELIVIQFRVLMELFGSMREEVSAGLIMLYNQNIYSL